MSATSLTDRLFDDADHAPLDPFALFEDWYADAARSELNEPHAMALATVDDAGLPDVRMVLCNGRDSRGFGFYTNFGSVKGTQLLAHPAAAMVMHWKSLRRQIRARGPVEKVSPEESDAYFATRARQSQIGAHASEQSQPLRSRGELMGRVDALTRSFGDGPVPRPPHWGGFRLVPVEIEFWNDGGHRLHDRVRFTRRGVGQEWTRQRLNP